MALDLRKEFKTNQTLEEEGVWVDVGDGGKLKIARAGNKKAIAYWRQISKPYMAQITNNKLSDELSKQLSVDVVAEAILLDWKGIADGGADIPYSKEAAKQMLSDYPDFRELVGQISNERKTYQKEIEEAITKK